MGFLISLIVNACAVAVAAYILRPAVSLNNFYTACIVSIALGVINTFIKPVVNLLTLPFNLLTLGLLSLVINGIFILFVSRMIQGFHVDGLMWAIIFGIVLTIISTILGIFVKN